MSFMSVEFIDTNVLVYAHCREPKAKFSAAVELIDSLGEQRTGALSSQVLAEFYSIMTGKLRMTSLEAEAAITDLSSWTLHRPSHADILNAIQLQRRYKLSWWDAMIVNSALETGAKVLWTEDLNHGQEFGSLVVRNPFA
ncbi:MAG: PIN domain-containing protein [Acidobacteriia bacterium]|nr:PIN domain-containing protein [Terriglobia bacterium]